MKRSPIRDLAAGAGRRSADGRPAPAGPEDPAAAAFPFGGLARSQPSRVLQLLVERDPLGLEARARRRLAERWLLLDLERVFQRAAARATYRALIDPPADARSAAWLGERVDEAIADCLSIDAYGRPGGADASADDHRLFAEGFGAGVEHARAASVHFHALPDRARRTLIEILMNGKTIDECLDVGLGPRERLADELELALDAATGDRARRERAGGAAGEGGRGA